MLPPPSLACQLRRPPPDWYTVEESPFKECVVVYGFTVPQGPCCPADTICLTKRGGQALWVNHKDFPSWSQEAWGRCGVQATRSSP